MSEETVPPVPTPTEDITEEILVPLDTGSEEKNASPKTKPSPKFIAATDLAKVVEILVGSDNISPEEAVHRLNRMCEKGSLLIVPPFGGNMRKR
jgi:hypothetical protein